MTTEKEALNRDRDPRDVLIDALVAKSIADAGLIANLADHIQRGGGSAALTRVSSAPDLMTAIEQAVDEWVRSPNESNSYGTVVDHNDQRALVTRIRTALEGASR
jgi:hypothetical protein